MDDKKDMQLLIESLSPNERIIVPYLDKPDMEAIAEVCDLNKAGVLRSLEFLANKGVVKLEICKTKVVELGVNGLLYRKKGLPERRLLNLIAEKRNINMKEAVKASGLSDNEFKAALGALKKRALINLINGNIMLAGKAPEAHKHTLEEQLIQKLPLNFEELEAEEKFAVDKLKNRKEIIEVNVRTKVNVNVTELGKGLMTQNLGSNLIEGVTADLIKNKSWQGKKFRRYDVTSPVPKIYGGKRHFVNQSTDYARKVWTELGFKEMTGNMVVSSFWNFDALFTAQDHPVREMQDTFFINKKANLPEDKKLIDNVKKSHEKGIAGSNGWQYNWDEENAKKVLLRTHTTCLSSQTLSKLKENDLPAKFFAVGKCFRNETVDWSHGFEFNQTEGIVIDKNANFRHLLGYLKQFAKRMGLEKVRFRPAYFPYTEPSVEGDVWNEEKQEWVELFAAGMLRPEVSVSLLGKYVPVLAWGPGIDRMIMGLLGIKDMRDLYKNDLNQLRKIKTLMKT
jgi:phenylalanyl-tRNA synthetase alpha chain